IEPRAPEQHAEDERADEAGVVRQKRRGEGRLALDASQQLQRALALVHDSRPPPRTKSTARIGDFPGFCTEITRSAPSPHCTTTPSSLASTRASSINFNSPATRRATDR